MIYIDEMERMVADSLGELHEFAESIGLKRCWFQGGRYPHYDFTTKKKIDQAIDMGATLISSRQLLGKSKRLAICPSHSYRD